MSFIFNFFVSVWGLLFAIFPAWFAICIVALIGFIFVIIIMKIVAFVLDTIPFV